MADFSGKSFVELLSEALGASNQSDLARKLGVTSPAISSLKTKDALGERQVANFIKKAMNHQAGQVFEGAISAIVEFCPVDLYQPRTQSYFFNYDMHSELCSALKQKIGIYSFYNSEGRIIYLGQTKKDLFSEMNQTFRRKFAKYVVYKTNHRRGAIDLRKKPKISRTDGSLVETASYFSAYEVDGDLIDPLEAFSIRLIPNNIVNSRMDELSKKG